jgi:4-hydroxy-2-oxoheptanedioate aldolase
MNTSKLIKKLRYLKSLGVVGVKQSLEDEGASFEEIIIMRKITRKAGLNLNVKIGGCEAKNDIYFCKGIKTNSIVAPMVESIYALKKFLQISKVGTNIPLLVNVETISAIRNLDIMIKNKEFGNLSGIVLGRSDLAGSLGLKKRDVNKKKIFNIVLHAFRKIKKKKKKFTIKMGGSITNSSLDFIKALYHKKLLDRVETRNIEIKLNNKTFKNFSNIINKAFDFEVSWLKEKINHTQLNTLNKIKLSQDKLRIIEIGNRGKY